MSARIKVRCTLETRQPESSASAPKASYPLVVESECTFCQFVSVSIENNAERFSVVVDGRALIQAIQNAMNVE